MDVLPSDKAATRLRQMRRRRCHARASYLGFALPQVETLGPLLALRVLGRVHQPGADLGVRRGRPRPPRQRQGVAVSQVLVAISSAVVPVVPNVVLPLLLLLLLLLVVMMEKVLVVVLVVVVVVLLLSVSMVSHGLVPLLQVLVAVDGVLVDVGVLELRGPSALDGLEGYGAVHLKEEEGRRGKDRMLVKVPPAHLEVFVSGPH